jgi:3-oxoacyl-[acyl-carrier-protein] synthase-3
MNTAITACGKAVPSHVLPNSGLEGMLDTTHRWIVERTGIEERRVAGPGEDNLSLALEACRGALEEAGMEGGDIGLIVVASATTDRLVPAMACTLQKELGAFGPALDINAGCSGFLYALAVADRFMRGGMAESSLVVGTETLTRIVDWRDRSTCVLFGDGAGAAVLSPCREDEGILQLVLGAEGQGDEYICAGGGGARMMASLKGGLDGAEEGDAERLPFLRGDWDCEYPFVRMQGRKVFRFAVETICGTLRGLCEKASIEPRDLDLVVPHQANHRIVEAAAERLGIPLRRFFLNINRYANTSSASIPIALQEAVSEGAVRGGDLVALVGFGAGLTWGGALLRWPGGETGKGTIERMGGR